MRLTDVTLTAGLFIGLAGVVLTVRQVGRRLGRARKQARGRSTSRLEGIADLGSVTALFGGMAVMQLGNVAEHVSERTLPSNPWLSFLSTTMVLLLFGVHLGRLLMRWQLRRLRAVLDTESGEITPRA